MFRFLNAKARIALGLVGLSISLMLLAFFLEIIPDKYAADIERRSAISETIAVYSTALVKTARSQRLRDDFELLVERNVDLLSLALRRESGRLFVATSEHQDVWQEMFGEFSTATQVKVPILSGDKKWGQLEIRFSELTDNSWLGLLKRPIVQLALFIGCGSFLIYYFYLGRVLRQLDPSQAVPGRVRSALDTMAEGLLILDRKEQIVLANQAFSGMIGKAADELIGFRAGELPWVDAEQNTVKRESRPWVVALASGQIQKDSAIRLSLPDGDTRTFKTNCSPVLGEGNKYAGVLVSFDDITELEQKEIELLNSKLEAEEANRAKSSFLANMSHEIRTPMNAILGFTEILKRGYVKNEQESLKYLNTIHSSGKNLLELINDILDLSKVESGHLEIERLKVEPYSILSEVVHMLQVKAQEKDLKLSFKALNEVPEYIETDPVRLRQIAFNLIGNSIKFTEQGEVEVSCRHRQEAGRSFLVIEISDTGIGMNEEAQKNIFNPFVQADSTVTRRFGGTGLGLAISRKFAQAMGGDISVRSKEGEGSTFSISLATGELKDVEFISPEQVLSLQEARQTSHEDSWELPDARVLVVDDGIENRELVQLLLENAGVEVDQAENGQVGVDMVADNDYDVVLMDVNMPVMDGFTAAGILRENDNEIPIIALTANAMVGFEDDCLAAGYSGYISKPIDVDTFMDTMVDLLGGNRVARSVIKEESTLVSEAEGEVPLYSSLPASNEKFRKIIVRFVDKLDEQIEAMVDANQKDDFATLADLAHWLKGAGGTVGFGAFTEPAALLEEQAKAGQQQEVAGSIEELKALAVRIKIAPSGESGRSSSVEPQEEKSTKSFEELNFDGSEPIRSRLAGNQRLQKTIGRFVVSLHEKLIAMNGCLKMENFTELADLAHWLKGSAGTVGFDAFTQPASELEESAKMEQLESCQQYVRLIGQMAKVVETPLSQVEETETGENSTSG